MMSRALPLSLAALLSAACAITPPTLPERLERERFEQKPWHARTYVAERATISYDLANFVSNVHLLFTDTPYHIKGQLDGADYQLEFDCRSQVQHKPYITSVLPDASYACYPLGEPDARWFVLAFDQECRGGVLKTPHHEYTLIHWIHDHYRWQEGFKVYDQRGELVGALSWSWGGEVFTGVPVDPSLPEYDRDLLALARAALLAASEGEEIGPVCGTIGAAMERVKPPPERVPTPTL